MTNNEEETNNIDVVKTDVGNDDAKQNQSEGTFWDFMLGFEGMIRGLRRDALVKDAEQARAMLDDGGGHIDPAKLSTLLDKADFDSAIAKLSVRKLIETVTDMLETDYWVSSDEATEAVNEWLVPEIEEIENALETVRQAFVVLLGFYAQSQGQGSDTV